MDLTQAITQSCDVYFYRVGSATGIETIARYAAELGLGQPTGIALLSERRGVVPSSEWKAHTIGEPWYPGETLSASIGQGYVGATPLQLANMMAIVASRGMRYQPHLVTAIRGHESGRVVNFPPTEIGRAQIRPGTFDLLRRALSAVVADQHGTGGSARSRLVSIAGKTGTAQVVGSSNPVGRAKAPEGFEDHAWFVAFAPVESPTIVVAVLVEHGGHGGATAAPVAKQVIETYLKPGEMPQAPPVAHDLLRAGKSPRSPASG